MCIAAVQLLCPALSKVVELVLYKLLRAERLICALGVGACRLRAHYAPSPTPHPFPTAGSSVRGWSDWFFPQISDNIQHAVFWYALNIEVRLCALTAVRLLWGRQRGRLCASACVHIV